MNRSTCSFIALVLTIACAGQQSGSVRTDPRNPDVLTRAELLQSAQRSKDLYQAILTLRPHFISPLTTRSNNPNVRQPEPLVVVDGARAGGLGTLRGILVDNVDEVRFMSPSEAAIEYGSEAAGGAILVKLFKQPKP